jgi:GxxExxY protein
MPCNRTEGFGARSRHDSPIPLTYRGHNIDAHFCPDIVVQNSVIIELKAVETLLHIHKTQVITYLKLTELPVGLLINFNVARLVDGVRRIVRPDLYVKEPKHLSHPEDRTGEGEKGRISLS